MKKIFVFVGVILLCIGTSAFAVPTNLLVNSGFETGDFSGWTIGGNSTSEGVDVDGTSISGADSPFPPNYVNVKSGNYAGWALVQNGIDPVERIILSQSISVLPGQQVDVGFWLGNDSNSGFGMQLLDSHTQIFIDGVGLLPSAGILSITTGSSPLDFFNFSGSFNTGSRTSIDVAFAINGSGTSRVGASFDDLYFISEASVPEPSTLLLLGSGMFGLGAFRKKFKK